MCELLVFIFALLQHGVNAQAETLGNLTLVKGSQWGASCLDGTPPGYLIRVATSATDQNKWVLHAEGGGWCYNEAACASRAKTGLGSSSAWPQETGCYGSCDGILSAKQQTNPDFHGWNAVFIGYCDGTSMTGNRTGMHQGLHYRGRANLDAVLDSLLDRGMADATDVVFTGGSAGGLAVYLNLDHVAGRVREHSPNANVVGLADAGFFLDHNVYGANSSYYTSSMQYLFNMSTPNLESSCMDFYAPEEAWKCMMAQYATPHVKSSLFMAEGMYDSWQLWNILGLGCGNPTPNGTCTEDKLKAFYEYGTAMNQTLAPLAESEGRGTFLSACIVHCQSIFNEGEDKWNTWTIQGTTLREAFGHFYFKTKGPTRLVDALPYPSNPSCPVWSTWVPYFAEESQMQVLV